MKKIFQIALLTFLGFQALQLNAAVAHTKSSLDVEVKPPKGVKTVTHIKEPNGGYKKGSPLYNKQEGIKEPEKKADKHPTEVHAATAAAVTETQTDLAGLGVSRQPSFYETLAGISVYAIFVLAVAFLYRRRIDAPLGSRTKGETPMKLSALSKCGFTYSFFDCGNLGSDWHICLTAYCCPIIQWARTASSSATPFMSYWKAIALLLTLVVLSPFTYGLSGIVIMVVLVMRRRDLRKVYSHTHPETRSLFEDLALVFCCPSFLCCQLVQEAREVEYTTLQPEAARIVRSDPVPPMVAPTGFFLERPAYII